MNSGVKLERLTKCKLACIIRKKYTVSQAVERYSRAYTRYRAMILLENRTVISPEAIFDDVAYVNALARYCTMRGVPLKEIR